MSMRNEDGLTDYGGLMTDIRVISEWRGLLPIIAKYQKSDAAYQRVLVILEAAMFALQRLEGDADGGLREIVTLVAKTLNESASARELAERLYEI